MTPTQTRDQIQILIEEASIDLQRALSKIEYAKKLQAKLEAPQK
jgi:hypothetical protein